MYNSRPRAYKGGFAVPENYSGNAFGDPPPLVNSNIEDVSNVEEERSMESEAQSVEKQESAATSSQVQKKCGIGFDVGRLFRGGIGFEELLILALILLISQNNNNNNDDVIVLLALLLFVS